MEKSTKGKKGKKVKGKKVKNVDEHEDKDADEDEDEDEHEDEDADEDEWWSPLLLRCGAAFPSWMVLPSPLPFGWCPSLAPLGGAASPTKTAPPTRGEERAAAPRRGGVTFTLLYFNSSPFYPFTAQAISD